MPPRLSFALVIAALVGAGLACSNGTPAPDSAANARATGLAQTAAALLTSTAAARITPVTPTPQPTNLLAELGFAAEWNADQLGGALTDEQLFAMATSIPARMAGIDDQVGALKPGLWADVIAIAGDYTKPYWAVVHAQPAEVSLVLIGGQAVYGEAGLMAQFWPAEALSAVMVGGQPKAIKMPGSAQDLADVITRLQNAFGAQGLTLAPLP